MRSVSCRFGPGFLALVLIVVPITAMGCTTSSTTAPPEQASVAPSGDEVALSWRAALLKADMDAALQLIAEDFASAQWSTRHDFADYLRTAHSRGYFRDAVSLDTASDDDAPSTPRVHPVSIRSAMGTTVWNLTIDESAQIASITLEIY